MKKYTIRFNPPIEQAPQDWTGPNMRTVARYVRTWLDWLKRKTKVEYHGTARITRVKAPNRKSRKQRKERK